MINSNRHFNLIIYLLAFLCFFGVIYLVYISNKGLDFTDEIFNLQGFIYPNEIKYNQTFFNLFIVKFIPFIDYNIVSVRLLRLVLFISSAFWLAYFFIGFMYQGIKQIKYKEFYFLFFFLLISNFLTYSTGHQALSYNTFSSILIQFILGSYFAVSTKVREIKWSYFSLFIHFFLIGVWGYGLLLTKFSIVITVLLPTLFLLFLNIYFYNIKFKKALQYTLLFFCAISLAFLVFSFVVFGSTYGFVVWYQNFTLTLSNLGGRTFSYLFSRYSDSIVEFYNSFIKEYFLLLISFFASLILLNRIRNERIKVSFILLISVGFIFFLYINKLLFAGSKFEGTQSFFLIIVALVVLIFLLFKNFKNFLKKDKQLNLLLLLFFFFIPIISSLGTTNWLTYQVYMYPIFWFLFIYFFFLTHQEYKMICYSLFALFVFVALFQFICGSFFYPYRVHETLSQQSQKITSKTDNALIYIHKKEYTTVNSVRILLDKTNFKNGDLVFSYMHQSGIVYLLGGKVFCYSLCSDYVPSSQNCFFINKYSKMDNLSKAFIILPKFKNDSIATLNCLKNHGADINKMIKLGEVSYSIYDQQIPLEIYSPQSRIKK